MSESEAWAEGRRVGYKLGREAAQRECPDAGTLTVEAAMTCYRQGYTGGRLSALREVEERLERTVENARRGEARGWNMDHLIGALDELGTVRWVLRGRPGRGLAGSVVVAEYQLAQGHVVTIVRAGRVRYTWECSCREPGVGASWSTLIIGVKRLARVHVFGRVS